MKRFFVALTALTACVGMMNGAEPAEADSVYLMAYFTSPAQHLFYAVSDDGLKWEEAWGGKPVFNAYDDRLWLRDPYVGVVEKDGHTTYHLVHTWGWDNPAIFHWQSEDLMNWRATDGGSTTDSGRIYVMDGKEGRPKSPNAWAPEFTYVPEEDLYYVYWSSRVDDRQIHYYTTTRDWLTFTPAEVLFDPGFTAIDLTVARDGDTFYGYYKDERNGEKRILCARTHSMNPNVEAFEGIEPLLEGYDVEVEGPSVFRKIGGDGWICYFDKFNGDAGLDYAETDNLASGKWQLVDSSRVHNLPEMKHGSVIRIPRSLAKQLK